ncbi:transposase IS4 domain-containing protein [Rutstroemia sp. NJR-2017a BVV2]|nr:transposase IS4 domain-containing protein [Rutstroemia sp. NJR-2017a BVV2]
MMATSGKSNKHILRHSIKGKLASNRSVFVGIIPYEGESENRVIGGKPASTKLYSISPLVSVDAGDFLGIFSGLWLDYSEIPGKLNRMKIARPGEKTNVCLAWEGVNEAKGEKSFCQYWRILVVATREILPFDQLIRPP